jgi:hypothetical protein
MMAKIPNKILEQAPESYHTPNISSKKVRDYQDSESDADSYGSLLTTGTEATYGGTETIDLDELPIEYEYPSYAAAAMGSTTSKESTHISSPTTSEYNDWQREKQELEALIQQQALQLKKQDAQIEQIQADLETKVTKSHELEEKLAQALELAHSRDARHEEMMEKFEMLMRYQSERGIIHHTTPDPGHQRTSNSESPPPKKLNTNSSPARPMYAVFRKTTGRHKLDGPSIPSTHFEARQASPLTAIQDMDTDDGPSHQPVVRPGKKLE